MNAFEQMNWPIWKTLTDNEKLLLMRQVLMYFVSPLQLVKDVTLKDFEISGIKCRTFEFTIDGEPFVFIPGNMEAILGWEKGIEGMNSRELISGDLAFSFYEKKEHPIFPTAKELNDYVNQHTSPLRKGNILPLVVSKYPVPYGFEFIGSLNATTGNFKGKDLFFDAFKGEILPHLFPKLTPEEALTWNFPEILKGETYKAFLDIEKNQYLIYVKGENALSQIQKNLRKKNYYFPTEDEFEYLTGGGSRGLFFFSSGKSLLTEETLFKPYFYENMFGVMYPVKEAPYFLTEEGTFKGGGIHQEKENVLEAILPLSVYAFNQTQELEKDFFNQLEKNYSYFKVIRIKP